MSSFSYPSISELFSLGVEENSATMQEHLQVLTPEMIENLYNDAEEVILEPVAECAVKDVEKPRATIISDVIIRKAYKQNNPSKLKRLLTISPRNRTQFYAAMQSCGKDGVNDYIGHSDSPSFLKPPTPPPRPMTPRVIANEGANCVTPKSVRSRLESTPVPLSTTNNPTLSPTISCQRRALNRNLYFTKRSKRVFENEEEEEEKEKENILNTSSASGIPRSEWLHKFPFSERKVFTETYRIRAQYLTEMKKYAFIEYDLEKKMSVLEKRMEKARREKEECRTKLEMMDRFFTAHTSKSFKDYSF